MPPFRRFFDEARAEDVRAYLLTEAKIAQDVAAAGANVSASGPADHPQ